MFKEINKLEKKEIRNLIFTDYRDRFPLFLSLSLFFFILNIYYRTKKQPFKNIFLYEKNINHIYCFYCVTTFSQNKIELLNQGNEHYQNEEFDNRILLQKLEKDNTYFKGNLNTGHSFI